MQLKLTYLWIAAKTEKYIVISDALLSLMHSALQNKKRRHALLLDNI
jgi:hypothetical protein